MLIDSAWWRTVAWTGRSKLRVMTGRVGCVVVLEPLSGETGPHELPVHVTRAVPTGEASREDLELVTTRRAPIVSTSLPGARTIAGPPTPPPWHRWLPARTDRAARS